MKDRALRLPPPSLESLFVATFALLGFRLGLRALADNSLFIHLRTGMDLVRTGDIPRTDPYSFTASGEPWVVQSWLASATYGVAERLGGFGAVRVVHGLLYLLVAWLLARSARTGSPGRTALGAALVIGLGVLYWSPRPLAFGILGLAATVLIVEQRRAWWLLVPVVWVWANSHGSFVLGLGWLVLVAFGEWLDGGRRSRPAVLPWLAGFVVGLFAAAANPLGPRLLLFPLAIVDRREAFSHVAEWRSPSFQSGVSLLTLACLVGIVVVVARARPSWRDLVPAAAFLFAGLVAQRNLPMAAVVLAPVVGRALRPADRGWSPVDVAPPRAWIHWTLAGVLGVLGVVFVAVTSREPAFALDDYPVAAARLVEPQARVATTDVAAGYLILRRDPPVTVLIDDRVDLYPWAVTEDYLALLAGRPGAMDVLDRRGADTVVWEADRALDAQLAASERWRRVGEADGWAVWVRTAP